jgi:hypothetical protein
MIKKIGFFVVMAVIIAAFGGCQKEELTDRQLTDELQPQEVVRPDVYVENGYLAFKNIEVADSIILLLNKMTTSEKETWENQMGFKSARAEFDALFEEYDKLQTYEAFLAFKEKNKDKLIFNENDPDDCSIGYPYATDYFIPVLNNKGLVKIGKSLIKYTQEEHIVIKDGDIKALDNLAENIKNGDVFVYSKDILKSATYEENDLIHDFSEDNPFGAPNPWHQKTSTRKLKNELRIERYRYYEYDYQTGLDYWVRGYTIYFKQQAQKKNWLGRWVDYKTVYTFDDLSVKVGNEPISTFDPYTPPVSPEVSPEVYVNLYWHVIKTPYDPYNVPPMLVRPTVSFSILTSCQGFNYELYRVDFIEHSGFPGSGVPFNPPPAY